MKSKILLATALFGCVLGAGAQNYTMKVQTKDKGLQIIKASDIEKVTFEPANGDVETIGAKRMATYLKRLPIAKGLARDNGSALISGRGEPVNLGTETSNKVPGEDINGFPGYRITKTTKYKLTTGYNEIALFNPTADILYPGCVLKGNTIANGTYAAITDAQTGPVTFSISLAPENMQDASRCTRTYPNIRMSDYQKAMADWANISFHDCANVLIEDIHKVDNEKEFAFKFGFGVKSPIVDVAGNLGLNFNKRKHHLIARIIQKGPSVTVDFPRSGTLLESVPKDLLDDYQPVYVSSINYGRMLFICLDTDAKETDAKQALEFAIKKIKNSGVTVDVNEEMKYKNVMSCSDMKITILGGSKQFQSLVANADLEAVKTFLSTDIPFNQLYPVSMQLRFVSDNAVACVQPADQITCSETVFVKDFKRLVVKLKVTDIEADGGKGAPINSHAIVRGTLGIKDSKSGKEQTLWNAGKDSPLYYGQGKRSFNLQEVAKFTFLHNAEEEDLQDMLEDNYIEFVPHLTNEKIAFRGVYEHQIKVPLDEVVRRFENDEPLVLQLSTGNEKWINIYIKPELRGTNKLGKQK